VSHSSALVLERKGAGVDRSPEIHVPNIAIAHLPQVTESVCSDIIELGLLLHLHITPHFIVPNFDWKNVLGSLVDCPAEKRDNS